MLFKQVPRFWGNELIETKLFECGSILVGQLRIAANVGNSVLTYRWKPDENRHKKLPEASFPGS
jgi:hypothetical protein